VLADTTTTVVPDSSEQVAVVPPVYPYRPARNRQHDLIHTRLEVRFDWEKHHLLGTATLELRPYFYPQNNVVLDAKGFDIHSVGLLENSTVRSLNYDYDGEQLDIDLSGTYTRNDRYLLQIEYTAKPDEAPAGGSAAITSDKGLYFVGTKNDSLSDTMRQIWTQGETEANSRWFPTIDAPNERTTQEMYITVHDRYTTLSNGVLVSSEMVNDSTRTDYWRMDQAHAPYLFMMAVGEFAKVEDSWRGIPVNYYLHPDYAPYAKDIFGHTPDMLTFFSDKLGVKYPWPKYAQVIVDEFVSGAMENTTASVFYDALLVDDRALIDSHWDDIIAHELFHHWFGDLVTTESWANLTLNEGFASYSEYLWNEHRYGKDEAAYKLWEQGQNYLTEAETKQVNLIRYRYADQEDMFDRHSYDKGSRVLHMLRSYVGDEAFFAALQSYLTRHSYNSVEVDDLRQAFEAVTGEDLNWFFEQWYLSSGHPQLKIQQRYANDTLYLQVDQVQDSTATPIFRLPTYVDVWVNGQQERYAVEVDQASQVLEFPAAQQPDLVVFDGEAALLAQVDFEKGREALRYQFKNTDGFVHQFQALTQLLEDTLATDTKQILAEALDNDFWVIRQTALGALEEQLTEADTALLEKVEQLARQDPRSLVQADAISLLASVDAEKYQELFRQTLEDSSYAVMGTSLAAYAQTSATNKDSLFARYQPYNNFNVVMTLADYYLANNETGHYDWFSAKISKVDDQTLYYFLNYFARYLTQLDNQQQITEGIDRLAYYAEHHPQYFVRMSAYRSLSFFDELPEVAERRQRIKAAETNEQLIQLYEQIP
jgi:aminopeptidase N